MTISVPANLMLTGEYLILEPNMSALIFCCEPRVVLTLHPSEKFLIESQMGPTSLQYTKGDSNKLFNAVEKSFMKNFPEAKPFLPWKITIDSSRFFTPTGEKKGFGSSAAVTIAYCACLFFLHFQRAAKNEELFSLALEAHRLFQDGRGSGYDIAASIYGGFRSYQSLPEPRISTPIDWPFNRACLLFAEKAVSTTKAVKKYENWKNAHAPDFKNIKEHYSHWLAVFLQASDTENLLKALSEMKKLFIQLGEAIGVNGRFEKEAGDFCKSLGAGNEVALALFTSHQPETKNQLKLDTKGILWNLL